jgi:DNA-binding transcriptional regulator GbsR (MarR family)
MYRDYLSGDCRMKYLIERDECPWAKMEAIEEALSMIKNKDHHQLLTMLDITAMTGYSVANVSKILAENGIKPIEREYRRDLYSANCLRCFPAYLSSKPDNMLTIVDIAKHVGVSRKTVSLVLKENNEQPSMYLKTEGRSLKLFPRQILDLFVSRVPKSYT